MTMINAVVTKNGFGIELISDKTYLTRLYACFVELMDDDFLDSLNFPAEHQDFLACFTYEIRKMQQGERMVNMLCMTNHRDNDFAILSTRTLWPMYIIQVSMLQYLAKNSKNSESIALIDSLVQCAIDAIKPVSLGASDVLTYWFNEVEIDGNYYIQHLHIINQEFIEEQVPSRETRVYELGNYLHQLAPKNPSYQDTVQKINLAASHFNCSPHEIESTQYDELLENVDW